MIKNKIYISVILLFMVQVLFAQSPNIVQMEYYFDTDPGFGQGTQVSFTASSVIDVSFNANLALVNEGYHKLFIRVKDADGKWSHVFKQDVFKAAQSAATPGQLPDIIGLEYYFDIDPGFGAGISVPISSNSLFDQSFNADLSLVDPGYHKLFVRVKDENGKWSHIYKQDIFKAEQSSTTPGQLPDIIAMEYYFDIDPGFGAGVNVPISSNSLIDQSFNADLALVDPGYHKLFVRVKDENGKWSHIYKQDIFKAEQSSPSPQQLPDIVAVEYFFDNDPGMGNATTITLNPDPVQDVDFVPYTGNIPAGQHNLSFRVKDSQGKWSLTYTDTVNVLNGNSLNSFYGYVFDANTGSLIENAVVCLSDGTGTISDFTTASNGQFWISNIGGGYSYQLSVYANGFQNKEIEVNVLELTPGEPFYVELDPLVSYSDYRIVPLAQAPIPDTIRIPQGGYGYAWYVVEGLWNGNWLPIPNVEITAEDDLGNQTGHQANVLDFQYLTSLFHFQNLGVVGVKVPATSIGNGMPGSNETITIVAADGQPLLPANQQSFEVKVEPFSYTADWGYRLFVKAGVGVEVPGVFSAGGFAGGGNGSSIRIGLEGLSNSPDWSKLQINRKRDLFAGLEASVGPPHTIGVNLNASAELKASVPYQQDFEFDMNDIDGLEALIAFYLFYEPAIALSPVPQIAVSFLSWSVNAIIDNSQNNGLGISQTADQTGLDIEGSVSTSIGMGIGTTSSVGLSASASLGANVHIGTSIRKMPNNSKETSFYIGGSLEQSTGIGPGIIGKGVSTSKFYPIRFGSSSFPNKLDVEFKGTGYYDNSLWQKTRLEASLDLGNTLLSIDIPEISPVSLSLSISNHQKHTAWLDIENLDVKNLLENKFNLISDIGNIGVSASSLSLDNNSFKSGFSDFLTGIYENQNNDLPFVLDYGIDQENKTKYDFEMEFEFPLPIFPAINFSIGAGINAYESQEFSLAEGYWVKGLPYLQYEIDEIPSPDISFYGVMQQLWDSVTTGNVVAELGAVIEANIHEELGSTLVGQAVLAQLNYAGATLRFANQAASYIFGVDGDFKFWSWYEDNANKSMSSQKQVALKKYIQNVKSIQQQIDGLEYGIGGFFSFKSDSLYFPDSTLLTITYSDSEIVAINELDLAIYWEDSLGYWNYLPSMPEPDSNRVSAYISKFTTYTLAPKLPQGGYGLHFYPDSLPANGDSIATIWSDSLFYSDGSPVDDGTLFTVWSARGNIISPDADTSISGIQVALDSCRVTFLVQADSIPTPIGITMKAVRGYAHADTSIILFDETIPGIPTLLSATGKNKAVDLSWATVGDPDLAGYKIYYGTDSIPPFNGFATVFADENPILVGLKSTHDAQGLFNDSLYYFALTSYDISGNESGYSNILTAIPFFDTANFGTQTIALPADWSLFSTYLEPINPSIDTVTIPILQNTIIVKSGAGGVYWPQYGVNMIRNMMIGEGYQIKLLTADTLIIEGILIQPENTPVALPSDWSILGYLRISPAPIPTMLSPISSNLIIVKNYSGNVYWPQYGVNMIGNMNPGEGYQVKLSVQDTLIYPSNETSFTKIAVNNPTPKFYKQKGLTGNNMTLGIPLTSWSDVPEIGDEIGIFDEAGFLVGSVVFAGGNTAITIWGDDKLTDAMEGLIYNDKFNIRTWSVGMGEERQVVVDNWLEGDDSYAINKLAVAEKISFQDFQFKAFELYQNQPNPFSNETEFSFYLPEKTKVEFSILNLLGEEIEVILSEKMSAGMHSLTYNSKDLPSGSYYYKLETEDFSETKKMMIVK
ncbi:MAG: carboxypeptidase regulatory-like domain-containing protein [Bacteroidales bacterium]|nr:carboxypeptidase regulatory-like domain-containing protein [Bacteroidales bacterium]MCF8458709.1 carboxypeptidase regulatory-like domain-containing protein [Bacteroidales bacterium]